jgi:predicted metal-dependent hydrolase
MKRQITINNKNIDYIFKPNRRSRRLRLSVHPGGELVVSAPFGMSIEVIENYMMQQAAWVMRNIDKYSQVPSWAVMRGSKEEFDQYKEAALRLVERRIEHFNAMYNFSYKNIAIKNQKTRWGSCSRRGNLNFNYKIVMLPDILADYIIVHELCHLREFNHSQKFWDLVALTIPNYRDLRSQLRKGSVS